ncbi:MAG: mannose-1-phosphate guanylyltransferase [Chloroflexia bacterium]
MYAVVLAGGSGTRLWPRSRAKSPKHLLNLMSPDNSMLQETAGRMLPVVGGERLFVVTNVAHADEVRAQLPDVPPENVLAEPVGKNSGPAVGYAAARIMALDPDAPMIVLPADHVILRTEEFQAAVRAGAEFATNGGIVTLGISPGYPDTGYGYMELGEEVGRVGELTFHRIVRFTEKPDLAAATEFVESGRYVWNSGMFMWTARTIMEEIATYMPNLHTALTELAPALGTDDEAEAVARVWPGIESQSIDYGVLERSERVTTLPIDIGWSDVGDWSALAEFIPQDSDGNAVLGEAMVFDSRNSLVYSSGRLITAIGLEDMIVVETEDALLICPKSRAQEVRRIVDRLKREDRRSFL